MEDLLLRAAEIYTEAGVLKDGTLLIRDGKIAAINGIERLARVLDLGALRLAPGLIDIHIHGADGWDTMDATYEAMDGISSFCGRGGVTTFVAATDTATLPEVLHAVRNAGAAAARGLSGAKLAGVFVEGPYLSRAYRGAHKEELLRPANCAEIDAVLEAGGGIVRTFLIAPEIEGGMDAIRRLRARGIIPAIGHTGADYDTAMAAVRAGGQIAVHTYNAMSPLTHRAPNMVGTALDCDDLYTEVICDGIHVDFAAVRVLARVKPRDKLILVSDSMRAAGLADGAYTLGAVAVVVQDGVARTADTGSLAGSTLPLARALKHLHEDCGVPLPDAIRAAALNPARAVGIDDTVGSIAPGKRADLIGLDGDLAVRFVMIDGAVRTTSW